MDSIDYLIVGGGIAGLTIANFLEAGNQKIILVNQQLKGSASSQSAGVMNPITGLRLVKSWNFEELRNHFVRFYTELEHKLEISFFRECKLIQLLKNPDEENQWIARTADPEYAAYFSDHYPIESTGIRKSKVDSFGFLKNVQIVDVEKLLKHWYQYFENKSIYLNQKFEYAEFVRMTETLTWREYKIKKGVVFCEGFRILENPYFNHLPIYKLKGEFTVFYSEKLNLNGIYKADYSIVPLSENRYWCGSNFSLIDSSLANTNSELQKQERFLNEHLVVPFEILSQSYGIRPSTKDRKPIIGKSMDDPRLSVMTGFGTKGFSLAPFCAKYLTDNLLRGMEIPASISSNRFE